MGQKPVLVTTTLPSKEEALKMANNLVKNKLAACVNIAEVFSVYEWENSIQEDNEFKLFIKSFEYIWPKLKDAIKENHTYSVPEISMIYIEDMHDEYKSWMSDNCLVS
ncbi:MAG: divalent-cation tolerance protein CutA [Spirochaetia bacterium]|nr:divalent-cation tolerance protein CutA [Spirochaetia bacterium]